MSETETIHTRHIQTIQAQLRGFFARQTKVKIYHGSTNSTRPQHFDSNAVVDISQLNRILQIDPVSGTIDVEPNVPMDRLVQATLAHGLIPPVVMEFPGITVGGGIQGGAGESSSFQYGLFHQNCLEYEMVLGNGEIVTPSPQQNSDLFYGTACAYGSLGVLTRIRLTLIPAKPYVQLTYNRVSNFTEAIQTIRTHVRGQADFVDGIMFSKDSGVVMVGRLAEAAALPTATFSQAGDEWFWLHAREIARRRKEHTEQIPIQDYLFRYDRGGFWVGQFGFQLLHLPFTKITRRWLDRIMHTRTLYRLLHASNYSHEYFVQDFSLPQEHVLEFMEYVDRNLGIYPLWLCPLKPERAYPLSPANQPTDVVMNIGVWGETNRPSMEFIQLNRELEREVMRLRGRKVLYAHAYYSAEEFWQIYNQAWYRALREKYHATRTFPDVYEKIQVRPRTRPSVIGGIWRALQSSRRLPIY